MARNEHDVKAGEGFRLYYDFLDTMGVVQPKEVYLELRGVRFAVSSGYGSPASTTVTVTLTPAQAVELGVLPKGWQA